MKGTIPSTTKHDMKGKSNSVEEGGPSQNVCSGEILASSFLSFSAFFSSCWRSRASERDSLCFCFFLALAARSAVVASVARVVTTSLPMKLTDEPNKATVAMATMAGTAFDRRFSMPVLGSGRESTAAMLGQLVRLGL